MDLKRIAKGKNIYRAGYDPVDGILAVQFVKSGTYRFKGVPEAKWISLQRVPYPDRYFTQAIKGQYSVEKPEKVTDGRLERTPAKRESDSLLQFAQDRATETRDKVPACSTDHGNMPIRRSDFRTQERRLTVEFYRAQDGLEFSEEGHVYKLKGQRVISLTQILAESGLVDYSGIDPTVLANKAKFGTKVHEYCLWLDRDDLDMDDLKPYPNYWNRVEGWRQFVEDFKFKVDIQAAEQPCAVKVNGMLYAMTVDRLGMMEDKPAIVEIKTCADREFAHQIQTAAQAIPMNEFFKDKGGPCKRYAVYLLDKPNGSGRYYRIEAHEDRMDERIFMAALMLTQVRINNKLLKGF